MGVNKDPRGLLISGPLRLKQQGGLMEGTGSPRSGNQTTGATGYGDVGKGGLYYDYSNGSLWVNEGSITNPYWTPLNIGAGSLLWGIETDFRDQVGKAIDNTDVEAVLVGSGLRIFGQGIAETDSGAVAQIGEGGIAMRLTTTDEAAHLVAIGSEAGVYQPDQHGLAIVDVEVTNVTAITDRAMGIGFLGLAADALDPPATGATTVATLVQDDMAIMFFDTGFTDPDRLYIAHNKSNAAATMTAVDTETDVAAAATYQRFRVEVGPDPDDATKVQMRAFVDKVLVGSEIADALDEDEEASPVFYIESNAAATKSVDVRRFLFATERP